MLLLIISLHHILNTSGKNIYDTFVAISMWGKIYAERKRQVLDNVALDDGSENLVLLTNVMF